MRNVVLARVDDRLIHGKVMTAWTSSLNANKIVIVDDTVAADKFNKRVLMALAPQGTKVAVLSAESATKASQKLDPGNECVTVLTKTSTIFEQLLDGGVETKEVCLGGTGTRGDRKPFINNVSASPDEADPVRRVKNEKGVNVYYQLVPGQKVVDISSLS